MRLVTRILRHGAVAVLPDFVQKELKIVRHPDPLFSRETIEAGPEGVRTRAGENQFDAAQTRLYIARSWVPE
jgi:hypothetical protein